MPRYIAIDIGAGLGAKIALFDEDLQQLDEAIVLAKQYGKSSETFALALESGILSLCSKARVSLTKLKSIGIASPGLFNSDGSYSHVENIAFLKNYNLKKDFENRFSLPVGIDNDAKVGALAEWHILKTELLFWVFGGGWGGAWINKHGEIMHPAVDWNGEDKSLHCTSEPGYSISLSKLKLRAIFYQLGVSYDRFEQILVEDLDFSDGKATGPDGSRDHLRAEAILSGPGRCRLFHSIVDNDDFYKRFLDIHETKQMHDPSIAGQHISKLSSMRVEAAVQTDRLFGKILAEAASTILKATQDEGGSPNMPICLGGKPSYALPYFGPSFQRVIGRMGFMNYLRPSVIDERGGNSNLLGAAVLGKQACR